MEPLVSVVVPIYNVERYLDKSIPSIIGQTYSNIEIILVDDGSTDGSLQKCLSYSKSDDRIVVVSKENGGVSSARNRGLDEAHGEYVTFVDADDYLDKHYITVLMKKHEEYPDSIIKCGLKHETEEGIPLTETEFGNAGLYQCDQSLNISNKYDFACVTGKLFDMKFINGTTARERFDETIHYGEDYLFCVKFFLLQKSMYVFEDRLYHSVSREGSAIHTFSQKRYTEIAALEEIRNVIVRYPVSLANIEYQLACRAFAIFDLSLKNKGVLNSTQNKVLVKTMRKYIKSVLNGDESNKYKWAYRMAAYGPMFYKLFLRIKNS